MATIPSSTPKPTTASVPTSTNKPGVAVQKTATASATTSTNNTNYFVSSAEKNILYKYRSWTYNFAMGALPPEVTSGNLSGLADSIKKYHVFDSAGKGAQGIGISPTVGLSTLTNKAEVQGLVSSFNKNSAGRFDMFIDDVTIEGISGAGSKQTGSSIATNISFTLYEPYSMNGFIEAMQVAAQAAGYIDYTKAVFAFRVQFQGYPDNQTLSNAEPELIPKSTRYFCIQITGIDVDVTENGTRYQVKAVPYNQIGFGVPNKITSDIKVSGNYVWEVLKNFFIGLNQMAKNDAGQQKNDDLCDKYEISCPALVTPDNPQNVAGAMLYSPSTTQVTLNSYQNSIIKAKMNDELKEVNVFQHGDPSLFKNGYVGSKPAGTSSTNQGSTSTTALTTADQSTGKLVPTKGVVVFAAGTQIHDCIAAVIRDSEYIRTEVLKNQLDQAKNGNGLITYFTIRLEKDIGAYDTVNNKYFCTYRYILEPYQMMYNRIPGQAQGEVDHTKIAGQIKREYDYIYTGKNLDITKFQLQFNNLFFEAIPKGLGNRPDINSTIQAAGPNNTLDAKSPQSVANKVVNKNPSNTNATPPIMQDHTQLITKSDVTAGQSQTDPYYKMAQTMHDAILNNVDMIQGTLEILGDPYFLVTGGMGNQDLDLESQFQTKDGQAPTTQGDLFITVNFRNPVDINSLGAQQGFAQFNQQLLPFSGIYRITTLKSNFKDGIFTQALDVIRSTGQILSTNKSIIASTDPSTRPLSVPGNQVTVDTAPATALKEGIRPNDLSLANLVSRGLPNVGLPGVPSNFTNAATGALSGILSQVSGATGQISALTNQLGVSPLSGINPLTSGINLSPSTLGSLASVPNLSAAAISAAGNKIGDLANIPNAATQLADNVAGQIPSLSALPQTVSQIANANVAGLVGNASNAVSSLQNSVPTDLTGIASKLGIDPSALSGLSTQLASKLTSDLTGVAAQVPQHASLGDLEGQGVFFAKMTGDDLAKLPATQPKVSAPSALLDPALASVISANGSVSSLLNGAANLPALTDINKVSNSLGSLTSGLTSGVGAAQGVFDQVQNAQKQISNVVGSNLGVSNLVGSLGQNSVAGILPATVGLGSLESNLASNASLLQSSSNLSGSGAANTVAAKFGSLQTQSPLAKLIQSSNIQGSI